MTESSLAPHGSFHPRNGAILTSGILLTLNGLGALGSGAMSVLQMFLMKRIGGLDPKAAAELGEMGESMWTISLANLLIYGSIGAVFLYAAYGCFTYRRWSRPLNLTLGWGWLYFGVIMMMSLVVTMGEIREFMNEAVAKAMVATSGPTTTPAPVPIGGIFGIIMAVYLVIIVLFVIVPPALILWLNWKQDVRHTLAWKDPLPRWTDRLPVTLCGLVISSIFFTLMSLPGVFLMNEAWMAPVLGDGPVKYAWWLVPVAWAYVAWGTLRRQIAAWFTAMISLLAGAAMGFLSMRGTNWAELYKQMGIPESDVGEMARMMEAMFNPQKMMILMIIGFVPLFGYLVWIFKDFRKTGTVE
jgi:hypothetical protein